MSKIDEAWAVLKAAEDRIIVDCDESDEAFDALIKAQDDYTALVKGQRSGDLS